MDSNSTEPSLRISCQAGEAPKNSMIACSKEWTKIAGFLLRYIPNSAKAGKSNPPAFGTNDPDEANTVL